MTLYIMLYGCFFFQDTATTEIYTYCHTLSLHDALPILRPSSARGARATPALIAAGVMSPLTPEGAAPISGVGAGSAVPGLATGAAPLWSRNRLSRAPPRSKIGRAHV